MAEYIDRNLIEWYGCDFEDGSCEHRECSECSQAECSHTQVMLIPTVNAIIIPEGATNGDMIKALFPNLEIADNGFHNMTVIFGDYRNQMYRNHYDEEWWNAPFIQPSTPNHNESEEHSCFKCRYLGWENVGDGMNPICEQEPYIEDTSDKDSGLHKSKPTVSDKNDCYWFDEKEK